MADTHPWQDRIATRLTDLASLPEGWYDGQGDRIDQDAIESARKFLTTLSVLSVAIPEIVPPGGIVPTYDGGVLVEWMWSVQGRHASIEFTADGRVEAMADRPGVEAVAGFVDEEVTR
jgi:hypothetical protein